MIESILFIIVKHKQSEDWPVFVEYDDNNLEHIMNSPDYGQPESGSKESAWSELSSKEYPDYVLEIKKRILKHTSIKFKVL